jgi:hypothetical protein
VKIVAGARFGKNVNRLRRVRFYLLPQVGNIDTHVIHVVDVFPAPDVLQYLPVRKHAVGVLDK